MQAHVGALIAAVAMCLAAPLRAEDEPEPPLTEVIRDTSPDGKYAMRIAYDAELNRQIIAANEQPNAERINSETMHRIELIETASGKALLDLMEGEDNLGGGSHFEGLTVLWSADSKWFAYYWTYPRYGYTTVYRLTGATFVRMNEPERLVVPTNGDVRNEYIEPLRWVKPGVLELKQIQIYRGEDSLDGALRFTVQFKAKGKFAVISKKRVPVEEEE
jgi:hypothetical protein